jgi:dienelactone hydrolase
MSLGPRRPLTPRLVGAVTTIAVSLGVPAAFAATTPKEPARQECSTAPTSWTAGSVDLCRGTLVYSDYVHDDYGADTGAVQTTSRTASLSPTAGDQTYPAEGQDATADLVRLTLRLEGSRLVVEGLLNALTQPRQTTLALAIDTDDDRRTGGGRWRGLNVSSGGWEELHLFSHGDARTNTIRASIPAPTGSRWRVQAATAITSTGQVMNVAFRGTAEKAAAPGATHESGKGTWFEDKQAAALASGDISQFGTTVRVADLRAGRTALQRTGPGFYERVYRSGFTIPPRNEGVDVAGVPGRGDGGGQMKAGFEQLFQYLGRYQPYGIYVPHQRSPHGMQMLFHGSSANFASLVNQPGMQRRFGEDLNRILVVPESRGELGHSSDISERDQLDVMADVLAHYPVERDKVFSGGYSQGGYIAYRMAMLYPDRFAGLVDWVGFTGDSANGTPSPIHYTSGAVGNAIDFVGNLRHVPTAMLYSVGDELVHVNSGPAMAEAFDKTDSPYTLFLHPLAEHLTFGLLDDWRKEAAFTRPLRRVSQPARVTFRTADFLGSPRYGIRHDRAYWVSQVRGRTGGTAYQDVDLTSYACGGSAPVLEDTAGAGIDPVPWVSRGRGVASTTPLARRSQLSGKLSNIRSLSIDTDATCLTGRAVTYAITTDGPATLRLSDGRRLTFRGAGAHKGVIRV